MRKTLLFSCLYLLLLISATKDEAKNQKEDLSVFREVLLSKEGTIGLHNSVDSVHLFLKYLDFKFKHKLPAIHQYKLYSAALSMIHCGHTQVHPNKKVLYDWISAQNALPFDVYFIGKHLIVNELVKEDLALISSNESNHEQTKVLKPGTEIIAIDGKSIKEIMTQISPYLSSDENGMDFKYYQAGQLFDFYRHLSSPFNKDSVQIKFLNKTDTNSIYIRPGIAPIRTINSRSFKNNQQSELDENSIGTFKIIRNRGYFRFKSFKASNGKRYSDFLKNAFSKIKTRKIKELIFDLRGNTGGVMQYEIMSYLLPNDVILGRYIIQKPKKGIENRHLKKFTSEYSKHRKASKAQKRLKNKGEFNEGVIKVENSNPELLFKGKIVVITDEGTFSSAAILACHLKTLCNAKIIGRPAGGSFYSGNAGSLMLQLPNSKFNVFINPNTFYSHLPKHIDPQLIKQPNIYVDTKHTDKNKRDTYYLKAAIKSFE